MDALEHFVTVGGEFEVEASSIVGVCNAVQVFGVNELLGDSGDRTRRHPEIACESLGGRADLAPDVKQGTQLGRGDPELTSDSQPIIFEGADER